jgi:hypothetical protein
MSRFLDAKEFVDRARARSSAAAGARVLSLDDARARAEVAGPRWQLDDLTGRLTELSGVGAVASLTAATALLLEAQQRGEPCAWILLPGSSFFPPDLAASGVDLEALVVVRARDALIAARAADTLLRSGGFALLRARSRRWRAGRPRPRAAWSAWPSVTTPRWSRSPSARATPAPSARSCRCAPRRCASGAAGSSR